MIKINNLHKSYKTLKVLKGIELEVKKGEIIALYGSSGSGKTTLLNIIGTLDTADTGFVSVSNLIRHFGDWNYKIANKKKRLANFIIDGIAVIIVCLLLYGLLFLFNTVVPFIDIIFTNIFLIFATGSIISICAHLLYYVPLESKYHVTLGKLITGTYVLRNDGLYASSGTILYRTIGRLFPFEPLSILFSNKKVGWHDRVSDTVVIEKKASQKYLDKLDLLDIKSEDDLSNFRNSSVGFIFQFHNLMPEFNVLENVSIPGYLNGRDKDVVDKHGMELLSILGIEDKKFNKPDELSGGEQQRVAVARALINNPDIILADEPAGSLDSENSENLHQIFLKLRDKYQTTFLIATHDPRLSKISDKVFNIKDGRIQA